MKAGFIKFKFHVLLILISGGMLGYLGIAWLRHQSMSLPVVWMTIFLILGGIFFGIRHQPLAPWIRLIASTALAGTVTPQVFNPHSPFYGMVFISILWVFYRMSRPRPVRVSPSPLSLGRFPLQIDQEGQWFIPEESLNYHVQVIGGTGSGKTRFVLKPLIYQDIVDNRIGCFIYDVKSNLAREVHYMASYAHREKELFYLDLAHPTLSQSYNPLFGRDPDVIANRILAALYMQEPQTHPYYRELTYAYLSNIIALLLREFECMTFQDLLELTQEFETFKKLQDLCSKYFFTAESSFFYSCWIHKPVRQRQQELFGLINKLQAICSRSYASLFNVRKPQIQWKTLLNQHQIFLFGASSLQHPEDSKMISALLMMDLANSIEPRFIRKPDQPFRLYLDEFDQLLYPDFIHLLNKAREAEISIILAHQALGDLKTSIRNFSEQIGINTRNKIILALDDPETASFFSRLLGYQLEKQSATEFYNAHDQKTGYRLSSAFQYKYSPDEIKNLPIQKGIIRIILKQGPVDYCVQLNHPVNVPETYQPIFRRARRSQVSSKRRKTLKSNHAGLDLDRFNQKIDPERTSPSSHFQKSRISI